MSDSPHDLGANGGDQRAELLALYDRALPQVFGYLRHRCGSEPLAEDLTAETFLAAVKAVQWGTVAEMSTAWLIAVARHKLVDHWRGEARRQRVLELVHDEPLVDDPWDAVLEAGRASETLARLGPHHRGALVLRYIDGLPVPDVATALDRTVHATEALLVRARVAFRSAYGERGSDDD
ncbi:MAG: RNA polymerase sigma factor [Acidimicrobiia bacterium]